MSFGFFRKKKEDKDDKEKKILINDPKVSEQFSSALQSTQKSSESKSELGQTINKLPSTQGEQTKTTIERSIEQKKRTIVVKRRGEATSPNQGQGAQNKKRADFFMKLILCGDGAVGKTAIRERYLGRGFSASYLQTIGADFSTTERTIEISGPKSVQYQIWDLAGQSEFQAVRGTYYEGCFGALMVFDITRPASFENIPKWIAELTNHSGRGMVPIVLLGNKSDLKEKFPEHVNDNQITIYINNLNEKCRSYGFEVVYLETSALTGKNIDKAFEILGINVVKWILTMKK